jgi:hypothetical protein
LPEETFAFHGLGCFPRGPQLAAPGVALHEGQRYQREELFKLSGVGHVRVLKVETPLLQVAEEQLNAPPKLLEFNGFVSAKALAENMEVGVAAAFALDDLAGEVQIHRPNFQSLWYFLALAGCGLFMGLFGPDDGIGLDPHDVTNPLPIKIFEPFLPAEFAVQGQDEDLPGFHQAKQPSKNGDAVFRVGIPSQWTGKNFPNDGYGDLSDDDANGEVYGALP